MFPQGCAWNGGPDWLWRAGGTKCHLLYNAHSILNVQVLSRDGEPDRGSVVINHRPPPALVQCDVVYISNRSKGVRWIMFINFK